jgi:ABC-type lipoprotein export system ATPase subunit
MLLQISNLTKQYTGQNSSPVEALRGVSFELAEGEFASVQGPSGCGKSTLLLAVGALLQPTQGQVKIGKKNPYKLSPEGRAKFRAKHIGFVFQQFHLVPYLSVRDNILLPTLTGESDAGPERADELLDQLQLTHRADHPPAQLSTGERQRTALARALLNKPQLLLADEPTGNLDRENADIVLGHLRRFADDGGAVLLVTHDPHAAKKASRAIQIEDGRLVES